MDPANPRVLFAAIWDAYRTPWLLSSANVMMEGAYEGADGIRRFFADVLDTAPDFRITIERLESIGTDRVLGFMRLNLSGRASGINLGSDIPSTNLYDFTDGKIKRVRIFLDRREALTVAGLSE